MSLEEVEVYLTTDLRGRAGIVREAEGRYRIWLVRVGEALNASPGPESYGSLNEARAYSRVCLSFRMLRRSPQLRRRFCEDLQSRR
jgi:hypothetical protein